MTYRVRERLAFWVDQALVISIAITSIWFASRIGYREAIRFARYEELRKARNQVRAVEHELALNEYAMRRALENWDSDDFYRVHVVTRAFNRAKESDEIYLLHPDTTSAISDAYDERLSKAIANIHTSGRSDARFIALDLYEQLEIMEAARPLLEKDIGKIEEEMRRFGREDVSASVPEAPAEPLEPTGEEEQAAAFSPSTGWESGAGKPYAGAVVPAFRTSHLTVPALPKGPLLITWRASMPGRKPAKIWIYGYRKLPPLVDLREEDGEGWKRFYSGESGEIAFVLCHPVDSGEGQIVDPNQPVGWRWAFMAVEDDKGNRYPVREPATWRIGKKEDASKFLAKPSSKALVLPKGYLR
ncbi:MAG: hypothetical protein HYY17_04845 [Planctomycetes bacterium]|nr:hypothetical protein [Planctomycetota bacterium]